MTNEEKTSAEYFADMMEAVDGVSSLSYDLGRMSLSGNFVLADYEALLVRRGEAVQLVRLLALSL